MPVSVQHIPAEVLLLIFSFFTDAVDLCHCLCTCKQWNEVAKDESLWRDLYAITWNGDTSSWRALFASQFESKEILDVKRLRKDLKYDVRQAGMQGLLMLHIDRLYFGDDEAEYGEGAETEEGNGEEGEGEGGEQESGGRWFSEEFRNPGIVAVGYMESGEEEDKEKSARVWAAYQNLQTCNDATKLSRAESKDILDSEIEALEDKSGLITELLSAQLDWTEENRNAVRRTIVDLFPMAMSHEGLAEQYADAILEYFPVGRSVYYTAREFGLVNGWGVALLSGRRFGLLWWESSM
jgi:hypothetical protein